MFPRQLHHVHRQRLRTSLGTGEGSGGETTSGGAESEGALRRTRRVLPSLLGTGGGRLPSAVLDRRMEPWLAARVRNGGRLSEDER